MLYSGQKVDKTNSFYIFDLLQKNGLFSRRHKSDSEAPTAPKHSSIFSSSKKNVQRSMSSGIEFGVAVIGCGIAGKVRIRDLTSNTNMPELRDVKLKGVVTK